MAISGINTLNWTQSSCPAACFGQPQVANSRTFKKMDNCGKASQRTHSHSWPTYYLKLCFQQKQLVSAVARGILVSLTHWSHLLQKHQENLSPASQLVRGWNTPAPQVSRSPPGWEVCRRSPPPPSSPTASKTSQLTFIHIDSILPALSCSNACTFRLAFHVYVAYLQSLTNCHIKADSCTS